MLRLTLLLSCISGTWTQHLFADTIRELGLSPDNHFNAAVGARVKVSPDEQCQAGNYCVPRWWYSTIAESDHLSTGSLVHEVSNLTLLTIGYMLYLSCYINICMRAPHSTIKTFS